MLYIKARPNSFFQQLLTYRYARTASPQVKNCAKCEKKDNGMHWNYDIHELLQLKERLKKLDHALGSWSLCWATICLLKLFRKTNHVLEVRWPYIRLQIHLLQVFVLFSSLLLYHWCLMFASPEQLLQEIYSVNVYYVRKIVNICIVKHALDECNPMMKWGPVARACYQRTLSPWGFVQPMQSLIDLSIFSGQLAHYRTTRGPYDFSGWPTAHVVLPGHPLLINWVRNGFISRRHIHTVSVNLFVAHKRGRWEEPRRITR